MGRKAAWIAAILLLLYTGVGGIYRGASELSDARTPLQISVTAGVLIYGILGLAAAVALLVRHRWSVPLSTAWAVVVTYVASTTWLAYAGEDATIGAAITAGFGAGLIGVFVVWCARAVTRPATPHERLHTTSGDSR
jgi:K+-transporting ATPase A subunit